jgi:hypothetical protein
MPTPKKKPGNEVGNMLALFGTYSCIPEYLCEQVESVQKRALRIICKNFSHLENKETTTLMSLKDRRETLCRKYFNRVNKPSNRLFNLLPFSSEHQYNFSPSVYLG